jgi:glycosyltransferase involved in cell wall biosynthesis
MIAALVDQWEALGHRVSLFIPADWSQSEWLIEQHGSVTLHKKRLRLPELPHRSFRGFVGGLLEFPQTLAQLRSLCREEQVDLLHLHTPRDYQLYFRLLRWLGGPPMVLTFHGTDALLYGRGEHPGMRLIRWIVQGMDEVTAVSQHYAQTLSHCSPEREKVHYLPNGIALPVPKTKLDPKQELFFTQLPEKFFIIVGWIEPPKGCDVAVRAWQKVIQSHPDHHLLFIGDHDTSQSEESCFPGYRDEIFALVEQLDCNKNIHFMGTQKPEQVSHFMNLARGLVFPSHGEGLPYVLLEAGAAGLPVACNDIPAFSAIIQHGENGLLSPDGNSDALAEAVISLISNPKIAEKMGQKLQLTIEEKFSAQAMAVRYLHLFSTLVDES